MTNASLPIICIVLMSLFSGVATAAYVESDVYLAGEHYSEWFFHGSKAICELKHEIPEFGVGRFLRLAGEELKFQINSFQPIPTSVEGLIREISPSWKHEEPDTLTSQVNIKQGMIPIELTRKSSSWLLSSLANGQIPSVDFLDWDDTRKKVHVRLSPVNYQKPYREFKRCLKELSAKGFEDYRVGEVHFPLDVHALNISEQKYLSHLAEYVIANDSIQEIKIDGHADDQGTKEYNKKLSERRANSVEEYLTTLGVKSTRFSKYAYGETRPKIVSRSEQARAANRRVEIRLYR